MLNCITLLTDAKYTVTAIVFISKIFILFSIVYLNPIISVGPQYTGKSSFNERYVWVVGKKLYLNYWIV
jgi:hypothetical protein